MVEEVKRDSEVSLEYMKIFEKEEMIREEGVETLELEMSEEEFVEVMNKFFITS